LRGRAGWIIFRDWPRGQPPKPAGFVQTIHSPASGDLKDVVVVAAEAHLLLAGREGGANEPVVQQRNAFRPFYTFAELERYRIYFDSRLRRVLW